MFKYFYNMNKEMLYKIYIYVKNKINQYNPDEEMLSNYDYSFNEYEKRFYPQYYVKVDNPETKQIGLTNLVNDCYIISFLQILIHTPDFLHILKKHGYIDDIIRYLILVSEYPYNIQNFLNLKKSFEKINPEYSEYYSNDSQEFGIDLINYIINQLKKPVDESDEDDIINFEDEDIITSKKEAFEKYMQNKKNLCELENLFLLNETQYFFSSINNKIKISSNLHIELTLQKTMTLSIDIEDLLYNKYNIDKENFNLQPNKILIKSQLVSIPKILIITINRVLIGEIINNSELKFKQELNLDKFIDKDLFNDVNKNTKYNLYAINRCIHQKKNNHYSCSIKINNEWYIFDDQKEPKFTHYPKTIFSDNVVGLFYIREN